MLALGDGGSYELHHDREYWAIRNSAGLIDVSPLHKYTIRGPDAERLMKEMQTRLRKFNLELHPDKTRLIEFGRFAESNRRGRGGGKPETFDFLGFTHYCGTTRNGKFAVRRRTMSKRVRRKLSEVKAELLSRGIAVRKPSGSAAGQGAPA